MVYQTGFLAHLREDQNESSIATSEANIMTRENLGRKFQRNEEFTAYVDS